MQANFPDCILTVKDGFENTDVTHVNWFECRLSPLKPAMPILTPEAYATMVLTA